MAAVQSDLPKPKPASQSTAASSQSTSGRTRFSGLASIEWCACKSSYRLGKALPRSSGNRAYSQAVDVGANIGLLGIQ